MHTNHTMNVKACDYSGGVSQKFMQQPTPMLCHGGMNIHREMRTKRGGWPPRLP